MLKFKLLQIVVALVATVSAAYAGDEAERSACHASVGPAMTDEYRQYAAPLRTVVARTVLDHLDFLEGIKRRLPEWGTWDKDALELLVDEQLESSETLSLDGQLYAPCIEGAQKPKDTETCYPSPDGPSKLAFERLRPTDVTVEQGAEIGAYRIRICAEISYAIYEKLSKYESVTVCSTLSVSDAKITGTTFQDAITGYTQNTIHGIPIKQSEEQYLTQWSNELCGGPAPTLNEAIAKVVADEEAGIKRDVPFKAAGATPANAAPSATPNVF